MIYHIEMAKKRFSVRLPPEIERALARELRRTKQTRTEVIESALAVYLHPGSRAPILTATALLTRLMHEWSTTADDLNKSIHMLTQRENEQREAVTDSRSSPTLNEHEVGGAQARPGDAGAAEAARIAPAGRRRRERVPPGDGLPFSVLDLQRASRSPGSCLACGVSSRPTR